jgi:hypothetical protein
MSGGIAMAADASNHKEPQQDEQQQRELAEIRRSFTEIGIRMGSLFEPASPNDGDDRGGRPARPAPADAIPIPVPPPAGRLNWALALKRRPNWALALVMACCLLVGGGLGYLLHRPTDGTNQPSESLFAPPLTQPAPTSAPTSAPPTTVPPSACLRTAQRGDELIDLLTKNIRDHRLSLALKAYTEASQACRKEASP